MINQCGLILEQWTVDWHQWKLLGCKAKSVFFSLSLSLPVCLSHVKMNDSVDIIDTDLPFRISTWKNVSDTKNNKSLCPRSSLSLSFSFLFENCQQTGIKRKTFHYTSPFLVQRRTSETPSDIIHGWLIDWDKETANVERKKISLPIVFFLSFRADCDE